MSNGPTATNPPVSTGTDHNDEPAPDDALFKQLLKRWVRLTTSSSPSRGPLRLQPPDGKKDSKELIHSGLKSCGKPGSEVSETLSPSGWTDVKLGCAQSGSADTVIDNSAVVGATATPASTPVTGACTAVLTGNDIKRTVQLNGPEDEIMLLRQMALSALGMGQHVADYAMRKHYTLTFVYANINSVSPLNQNFFQPVIGTGTNNRTSNAAYVHSIRFKFDMRCRPATTLAQPTATLFVSPQLLLDVFVDKIPSTIGAIPACYIVGANPETSTTSLYTNLGAALDSTNPIAEIMPTRNYNTMPDYHILHHEGKLFEPTYTTFYDSKNDLVLARGDKTHHHYKELHFKMHGMRCTWGGVAATAPCVNALCLSVVTSTTAAELASAGYALSFNYTMDVEFSDAQDDLA